VNRLLSGATVPSMLPGHGVVSLVPLKSPVAGSIVPLNPPMLNVVPLCVANQSTYVFGGADVFTPQAPLMSTSAAAVAAARATASTRPVRTTAMRNMASSPLAPT